MYDLATGTESVVCAAPGWDWYPAIWGNRVVWQHGATGTWDIWMYDIASATLSQVCTAAGAQSSPAIWGDRIVWEDNRDGDYDIYMYDLATASESPICLAPGDQRWPHIWGDRVVWHDTRNGPNIRDIYMYDLSSGVETLVCSATACASDQYWEFETWPAIWDDLIVWEDRRAGAGAHHLYIYDLGTRRETPIGMSWQLCAPAVWGDRIVWQDDRNGDWNIYVRHLAGVESAVCTTSGPQLNPRIWRDRVVWQDFRSGNWDIYMRDLWLGIEMPLCTNAAQQGHPGISGDRIVWEDDRNGNVDIYMYDLYGGAETPICTNPADQLSPALDATRVVWCDLRDGNGDIYAYDLATRVEIPVCTHPAEQGSPSIWGTRVVWEDQRGGDFDIYMRDLATGTETAICVAPGDQRHPSVHGNRIVWQDYRSGTECDVYCHDLTTGVESLVCGAAGNQEWPVIWGDRIVWQDSRSGRWGIYWYELAMCSFDDVPRSHQFWRQIEAIYAEGVTGGTSTAPPLYSPTNNCTRGQMAVFICRAWDKTWLNSPTARFTDVPRGADGLYSTPPFGTVDGDGTHVFYGWIERLADPASWGGTPPTGGYGDGTFRPNLNCPRAHMAVFICRAAGKTWYAAPTQRFTDVARGSNGVWNGGGSGGYDADGTYQFYGWIERLADASSWGAYGPPTAGYGDGTFRPNNNCTRAEMAAFLQRAAEMALPIR